MFELLLTVGIAYFGIVMPFNLWKITGKYEYLKKETDERISHLEFNNQYYVDQINHLKQENAKLAEKAEVYRSEWYAATDKIELIEEYFFDMPDEEQDPKLNKILFPEDFEEYDDVPIDPKEEFFNE